VREKMRRDWTTDNGGALNTFWAGAMSRRVAGSKGGRCFTGPETDQEWKIKERRIGSTEEGEKLMRPHRCLRLSRCPLTVIKVREYKEAS